MKVKEAATAFLVWIGMLLAIFAVGTVITLFFKTSGL